MTEMTPPGDDTADSNRADAGPPPQTTPEPAMIAPAQYPQAPAYPVPVVTPQASPAPQPPQSSSSAVVALVLAIASWAVCPLVLAIIALVFASKADREIATSGGRIQGGSLSTAAKIVSWINIGVYIAVIVVMIFIILIAVIAGGLSQITPTGQV